jgi:hypothetical protein
MYAPSTASGAQWMTRITCLHASGYLRRRAPMEPIVGGRRMVQAADGASTGTNNAVKGTDNASKGTNNAVKGTDNASKGTNNADDSTDGASKGTNNAIRAPRFASYWVPG